MSSPITLGTWLVGRGLTAQQAALWSDFIADSLELLDDAYSLLKSPTEWTSFKSGCHAASPTEPELTSGIGDRMHRLWQNAPLESPRTKINATYERPTPGDDNHGIRKSKADFRFEIKFEAGLCPAFVLEAKGLRIPSDLTGKYLGPEGIGCFTSKKPPYTTDIVAGMVGYAYKTPSTWQPKLVGAMPATGASRVDTVVVGPNGRKALASDHCRKLTGVSGDITVLHSVLDFR